MLSRMWLKNQALTSRTLLNARLASQKKFSTDIGFGDAGDVLKVHYTEEFDQGLTAEQKA